MTDIHPGPVVTLFECVPQSGTKLSKISGLRDELAMRLEVERVRIVAPIPGKNAVGFEIPNANRATVGLREVLAHLLSADKKAKLPLALGRDIGGLPYGVDLAKMPHLIVAGTTGSGKSVCVNAMLLSLLYRYAPKDLRLILIDPKEVELGGYDGIPHLLVPVVVDMRKAASALKWAVDEMERRYDLFARLRVRNLEGYNKKAPAVVSPEAPPASEGDEEVVVANLEAVPVRLPYVVIVLDELADLMMVAAREVETAIARLAQKARAAGIHLVVATQRPSTDVMSGTIRNNFPARISFRVATGIDSRTVLDTQGAESLLGAGDMLVRPPGTSDLVRVHGAYVSDDEVLRVVEHLKSQGRPVYEESVLSMPDEGGGPGDGEDEKSGEQYDEAVALVAREQRASVSFIQRHLRIGYNTAARLMEKMEKEGVVGPERGSRPREVFDPVASIAMDAAHSFLVADQNPRFLEKAEEILRDEGYRMIAVADGVEAKVTLARSSPTGVLAHVDLPRLDGASLCRFIKSEHDERLPVILMAAEAGEAMRRAEEAGADNVLFRPVKRAELLFAARTMIRLRRLGSVPTAPTAAPVDPTPSTDSPRTSRVSQFEFFKAFLAVEIKRARRYGFPLSLMLASLDSVETIERDHGERVLRQLLNGLARAVRRSVRDIDIPVTLRDDTILVLMPHTAEGGASAVAERVRQRIRRSVYREGDLVIRPTISIGSTTHLRETDRNFSQVMRRASAAMRDAMRNGGDQVVVH